MNNLNSETSGPPHFKVNEYQNLFDSLFLGDPSLPPPPTQAIFIPYEIQIILLTVLSSPPQSIYTEATIRRFSLKSSMLWKISEFCHQSAPPTETQWRHLLKSEIHRSAAGRKCRHRLGDTVVGEMKKSWPGKYLETNYIKYRSNYRKIPRQFWRCITVLIEIYKMYDYL